MPPSSGPCFFGKEAQVEEKRKGRRTDRLVPAVLGLALLAALAANAAVSSFAIWALYEFGSGQLQRREESKVRVQVLEEMAELQPFLEKKEGGAKWTP